MGSEALYQKSEMFFNELKLDFLGGSTEAYICVEQPKSRSLLNGFVNVIAKINSSVEERNGIFYPSGLYN